MAVWVRFVFQLDSLEKNDQRSAENRLDSLFILLRFRNGFDTLKIGIQNQPFRNLQNTPGGTKRTKNPNKII